MRLVFRPHQLALWFGGLLLLLGCTQPPPPPPGNVPVPPASPAPVASPVTWTITHTASGLQSPGGPLHLAPPYGFELAFSGPVDRAGVEGALAQNLCCGQLRVQGWSGDRLTVAIEGLTPGGDQVAVDPRGGRDREGRQLGMPTDPPAHGFPFWPADPTGLYQFDPVSGQASLLARYPQPFQTIGLLPGGQRVLLRQHILTPGQSVGITGTAHIFDLPTERLEALEMGGLFRWQWSDDGGLLVLGQCPRGQCVTWVRPGPYDSGRGGARRLLYMNEQGEYVADAHLAPGGQTAAIFAGKWGERLNLHLIDLRPETAGRRLATIPAAAGVTQGPSGITSVPAAWSPDGGALVYGDGGVRRDQSAPMQVWLLMAADGQRRLLAEGAVAIGPWRPAGDLVVLGGVGVVDRQGQVQLAARAGLVERGYSAWSPDGQSLYLNGAVYDAATWQVRWRPAASGSAVWAPGGQAVVVGGNGGLVDGGGLYRADGTLLLGDLVWDLSFPRPRFSPDGTRVYLPNPDRVVELATGKAYPVMPPAPAVPGLGDWRPLGFTPDGQLLLAVGHVWDE